MATRGSRLPRITLALALTAAALSGLAWWAARWVARNEEAWVARAVDRRFREKVEPRVRAEFERRARELGLEFRWGALELRDLEVDRLRALARWAWNLATSAPADASPEGEIGAKFTLTLDFRVQGHAVAASLPVAVQLPSRAPLRWEIRGATVRIAPPDPDARVVRIEVATGLDAEGSVAWSPGGEASLLGARARVRVERVQARDAADSVALLSGWSLEAEATELAEATTRAISGRIAPGDLEITAGDLYLSPDWKLFGPEWTFSVRGNAARAQLGALGATFDPARGTGALRLAPTALARLRDWAVTATRGSTGPWAGLAGALAGALAGFDLRGTLELSAPLARGGPPGPFSFHLARAAVAPMAAASSRRAWLVEGIEARGQAAWGPTPRVSGRLAIGRMAAAGLSARLADTPFDFEGRPASRVLSLGETGGRIPLEIEGLSPGARIELGSIAGEWDDRDESSVSTRFEASGLGGAELARWLCLPPARLPPLELAVSYPKLWLWPDAVETEGSARLRVFEGELTLADLRVYRMLTAVPEIQLSAELKGVRLRPLGLWSGFGEMDGKLEAWFREATFQRVLPTQFAAGFRILPDQRNRIVFSPEAMRNFARLFAGEGMTQLPPFADWLAFGWPSRVFGGYDVRYAGLRATGRDGGISIETLDPPEILAKERKRFILYGPRFKMPVSGSRYPWVLDGPGVANLVKRMVDQARAIADSKKPQQEENSDGNSNDTICPPLDFHDPLPDRRGTGRVRDGERQLPGERRPEGDG